MKDLDALKQELAHDGRLQRLQAIADSTDGQRFADALDGVKFFCTHGDRYGVKYTLDALLNAAYFAGADIVLFGHTHRALSETMQGLYVVNPGTAGVGAMCTYACIETRDGAIRSAGIHAIPEV